MGLLSQAGAAATENSTRTAVSRGAGSSAGPGESTTPASLFSRLLAGKLTVQPEIVREASDRSRGQESPGNNGMKNERDITDTDGEDMKVASGQDNRNGSGQAAVADDATISETARETPAEILNTWGSPAGLLPMIETGGATAVITPGAATAEGIPAAVGARLAADIAAGYSLRNGMQTVTMKLDADHLGRIDVRLQAKGDHLSIRLSAESRESENALRENSRELSEAIQKRTGRFQHVEVRVELKNGEQHGRKATDRNPDQPADRDPWSQDGEGADRGSGQDRETAREMETEPENRVQGG